MLGQDRAKPAGANEAETRLEQMTAKYESMKKALRSYESAVEKLQNKRDEERRERKAKD